MLSSYGYDLLRSLESIATRKYFVDVQNGNDSRYSGRSKRRPFKSIMQARNTVNALIDWAGSPGWLREYSIIYVAPGVYREAIRAPFCGAIVGCGILGTDTGAEVHPTSGSAFRNPPTSVSGSFAGTLTTRTDADTGVFTAAAGGHGVITGDDVDIYWDDPDGIVGNLNKCRLNMDATVSVNAITVDGGEGDDLPIVNTTGYAIEQSGGTTASQVSGATCLASAILNMWFECESAVPCMRFGTFNNSIIADCIIARGNAGLTTNAMEFDNVTHAHLVGNRIESGVAEHTKGMVFNGGADKYLHASMIEENFIKAVTTGIEIAANCTATGTLIRKNVIARPVKGIDDNNGGTLCVENMIAASSDAIEHAGSNMCIGNLVIDNATPKFEPLHANS